MTKNIKIGSSVFFGNMSDYVAKDIDEMIIQDKWLPKGIPVLNMKKGGRDIFFWSSALFLKYGMEWLIIIGILISTHLYTLTPCLQQSFRSHM